MGQAHYKALSAKHSDLENRIQCEKSRPNPDDIKLLSLKKQKLRIKDELKSFSASA